MLDIITITIGITAIISLYGFNNPLFFDKYKFNVSAVSHREEYLRLLSSGFLHADIMHLVFNMYTLFIFAPIVLQIFGILGFLLIYIGAILLGNLFSLFIYRGQGWYSAIGASGGVSGILFASIAMVPDLGIRFFFIPIDIPGYIFGLLYFGYSVYSMLNPRQNDMIGHAAHLGGAFLGLVFAVLFQPVMALENIRYIGIMSLPLLYLAYEIFVKKRR